MKAIAKILCAVDFSRHSAEVAAYATTLAKAFGADLTVVHVAQNLGLNEELHNPATSLEALVLELFARAEQNMKEFVPTAFNGMQVHDIVLSGDPAEEIVALAESGNADLIVVGTHGRKGLDRILFGSVAGQVVSSSPVPVFTVRPTNAEKADG